MIEAVIAVVAGLFGAVTAWLVVSRRVQAPQPILSQPPERPEQPEQPEADDDRRTARERDERATLMEQLSAVVADVSAELDLDVVLDRMITRTAEVLEASGVAFVIVEDDANRVAAAAGVAADWVDVRLAPTEGIFVRAFGEDRQIIVEDYQSDPDRVRLLHGIGSAVITPVRVRDEHIGALMVYFPEAGRTASAAQLEFLRLLVSYAGSAVANARAYGTMARGQALAQEVIDRLIDGVAVLDDAGNVSQWNRAAAELTGLVDDAVIGRPFPWRMGTRAEPVEHQLREDVWVETVVAPLPEAGGSMVVLRDVSRQKAQTMLLALVSHELRTPLTVIVGYARRLQDHGMTMSVADRARAIEAIRHRAAVLNRLIEQLMAGSLVDLGRLQVEARLIDVEPALRACAALIDVASTQHELVIEIAPDLPHVVADEHAVEIVLDQLVENAVKYSPAGGVVRVTASLSGDSVVVSVSDDGVGLLPGDEERVFDRFGRGSSAIRGAGLGLFIVQRLVEAQRGRVWARRRDGGGATFSFSLPLP